MDIKIKQELEAYESHVASRLKWESSELVTLIFEIIPFLFILLSVLPLIPSVVQEQYFKDSTYPFWYFWLFFSGVSFIYWKVMEKLNNKFGPPKISKHILLTILPFQIAKKIENYNSTKAIPLLEEIKFLNKHFERIWIQAYFVEDKIDFINLASDEAFSPLKSKLAFPLRNSNQIKNLTMLPWIEISPKSIQSSNVLSKITSAIIEPIEKKIIYPNHANAYLTLSRIFFSIRELNQFGNKEAMYALVDELDGIMNEFPIQEPNRENETLTLKQSIKKFSSLTFSSSYFPFKLISWFLLLALVIGLISYYVVGVVLNMGATKESIGFFATVLAIAATLSVAIAINTKSTSE